MTSDRLNDLVFELATAEAPSAHWLSGHRGAQDPVTAAWVGSTSPHAMVQLLAIAQHPLTDGAAQAAIAAAVTILRREQGSAEAASTLAARVTSPTAPGELAHLLFGVFVPALRSPEKKEALFAEIAHAVRKAVQHPPALAQLTVSPQARAPQKVGDAGSLSAVNLEPKSLRALSADEVRAFSHGQVISPFQFGRSGPELGGLVRERAFGRWSPRSADHTRDERSEYWGFIELRTPVTHPLVPTAKVSRVPLVPPYYRRSQRVSVDALRAYARERRAALEAQRDLCDPVDQILAEEGLADPAAINSTGLREHRLNTVYRSFINLDGRIARLRELGAPAQVIDENLRRLQWRAQQWLEVWRAWLTELPGDTDAAWALRAVAVRR